MRSEVVLMGRGEESQTNIAELQVARTDALELQRGTVLAGRYEIESSLGRGGAGVVLRAHDRELHEAVAIKVLRPELAHAARWIERLAREVKLARQLRHPNVCRVFDFEKAEGHVFIVMELATGGTLRAELEEGTLAKRPLEARVADARAVASGLAAIHEAGIAHRDVTPQNVLRMADGRLVVSDFGLATEISQTTTSLHGGTLAYMAPEVVRGQRGTFASDVWALGVVVHEIAFGARPTWSRPIGGALLSPVEGRTLARGERLALDVCRACTEDDPAKRPRSAREVEAWLAGERRVRARARKPVVGACLLVLGLCAGLAAVKIESRHRASARTAAPADPLLVQVEAGGADLTDTAKVLATVEGRVQCITTLPDRRTLRFVWGTPPKAVDLDTVSGRQWPSRLTPAAFANGCPQVSPDGRAMVFQGYLPDGSAQAFVSGRADGANAVPVVAIADPTLSSEPKWTPDGQSFIFDADSRHVGAFSMTTRRATILPEPTSAGYQSLFKFVADRHVYLAAILSDGSHTEVVGLKWPSFVEDTRFRLPGITFDLGSLGDRLIVTSHGPDNATALLTEVNPQLRRATELGGIQHQWLRDPVFVEGGLAFRSWHYYGDLWTKRDGAVFEPLTHDGHFGDAKRCGDGFIATEDRDGKMPIVRLDWAGRIVADLTTGDTDQSPTCTADGKTWFFNRAGVQFRCNDEGCRTIATGVFKFSTISPDGRRLVALRLSNAGPVVSVMSSEGGASRDIAVVESVCAPGWSSNETIWLSRRTAKGLAWTELNVDTGRGTGRVIPGTTNCSQGDDDPASPVDADVHVVVQYVTQIRLAPQALFERRPDRAP